MFKVWPCIPFYKTGYDRPPEISQVDHTMITETLEIIKQKDDWKFTVEIKENAKGEPDSMTKQLMTILSHPSQK